MGFRERFKGMDGFLVTTEVGVVRNQSNQAFICREETQAIDVCEI